MTARQVAEVRVDVTFRNGGHLTFGVTELLRIASDEMDVGAEAGHAQRGGEADSRRRTRHKDATAAEVLGVSPCLALRPQRAADLSEASYD